MYVCLYRISQHAWKGLPPLSEIKMSGYTTNSDCRRMGEEVDAFYGALALTCYSEVYYYRYDVYSIDVTVGWT